MRHNSVAELHCQNENIFLIPQLIFNFEKLCNIRLPHNKFTNLPKLKFSSNSEHSNKLRTAYTPHSNKLRNITHNFDTAISTTISKILFNAHEKLSR